VQIPSLTSSLPISSSGDILLFFDAGDISSHPDIGGLAAWAEDVLSNVLWCHLSFNIAAAAWAANLPASYSQDLYRRMHERSVRASMSWVQKLAWSSISFYQ
jgi:hypothetical protein